MAHESDLDRTDREGFLQEAADRLGESGQRLAAGDAGNDDGEFVAAPPSRIAISAEDAYPLSERHQDLVTDRRPEGLVELAEVIDIDQDQRRGLFGGPFGQAGGEARPVEEAR